MAREKFLVRTLDCPVGRLRTVFSRKNFRGEHALYHGMVTLAKNKKSVKLKNDRGKIKKLLKKSDSHLGVTKTAPGATS